MPRLFLFVCLSFSIFCPFLIPSVASAEKTKGVIIAYRDGSIEEFFCDSTWDLALQELSSLGVNSVAILLFAVQETTESTKLDFRSRLLSLDCARSMGAKAQKHGINIIFRPLICLQEKDSENWRGTIAGSAQWFSSYEDFILKSAQIAHAADARGLVLGVELVETVRTKISRWNKLVKNVRTIYPGDLHYHAHHAGDLEYLFEQIASGNQDYITFYRSLDILGFDLYTSLASSEEKQDFVEAKDLAQRALSRIKLISERAHQSIDFTKPLILSEAGFKNTKNALYQPWRWSGGGSDTSEATQAFGFEVLLEVFYREPLISGFYFWNWDINDSNSSPPDPFNFRDKSAALVLKKWFVK